MVNNFSPPSYSKLRVLSLASNETANSETINENIVILGTMFSYKVYFKEIVLNLKLKGGKRLLGTKHCNNVGEGRAQ